MKVNPFSTRYVRPGAIPWQGEDDRSLAALASRFEQECSGRAAIIGPHGTGKSTLLEHLVPLLGQVVHRSVAPEAAWDSDVESNQHRPPPTAAGRSVANNRSAAQRTVVWLALRRNEAPFRQFLCAIKHWKPRGLVVMDGFEQLSIPTHWLVQQLTKFRGQALLVTTHATCSLPTLIETRTTVDELQAIIEHAHSNAGLPNAQQCLEIDTIESLLKSQAGNAREVLMLLYDLYTVSEIKRTGKA